MEMTMSIDTHKVFHLPLGSQGPGFLKLYKLGAVGELFCEMQSKTAALV